MTWPFGGIEKRVLIGPVILTNEERQECQNMLNSLSQAEGGEYVIREDLADSFRRSIIALCMMGRAERFLILSNSKQEYKERACEAAAKACGIFPLSIYFYDFGSVLEEVGRPDEAKQMFAEFLRRFGTEDLDPIMESALKQRDVEEAVREARRAMD